MINQTINPDLFPTEKDLAFFNQNGWYKSPVIFSDEEIECAVKGAYDFYEGKIDFPMFSKEGLADDDCNEELVIKNNEFVTLQKKELRDLGWHPMIREIAKILTQSSEMRLFADSLICKNPSKTKNTSIVGWHSDKAYWPTCSSDKLITVWIPLQDCTIEMGPLVHIDGSHKWKNEEDLKEFFSFNNQDLNSLQEYLEMKKGSVSFHSCHTIHSSAPNTSNIPRLALAVHLQDDGNFYKESFKENGEKIVIGYDRVCAKDSLGNPDYKDPKIFPII